MEDSAPSDRTPHMRPSVVTGAWVTLGAFFAVRLLYEFATIVELSYRLWDIRGNPFTYPGLVASGVGALLGGSAGAVGAWLALRGRRLGHGLVAVAALVALAQRVLLHAIFLERQLDSIRSINGREGLRLGFAAVEFTGYIALVALVVWLLRQREPGAVVGALRRFGLLIPAVVVGALAALVHTALVQAAAWGEPMPGGPTWWPTIAVTAAVAFGFSLGAAGLWSGRAWGWMLLAGLGAAQSLAFLDTAVYALSVPTADEPAAMAIGLAVLMVALTLLSLSPPLLRGPDARPSSLG